MSDYEFAFWGDCANTFHEEQKQLVYAKWMGLTANWNCAHPPTFDLRGASIVDVGGGPVSLLLKCVNYSARLVVDPAEYPNWVGRRYYECGFGYVRERAEDYLDHLSNAWDEAWIYNVLQHVDDPEKVVANARRAARIVRLFEWVDVPAYAGHPQTLDADVLRGWLDGQGSSIWVDEAGAVGKAFVAVAS